MIITPNSRGNFNIIVSNFQIEDAMLASDRRIVAAVDEKIEAEDAEPHSLVDAEDVATDLDHSDHSGLLLDDLAHLLLVYLADLFSLDLANLL